ncbi:hypothetical protein TNIN_251461 [Trichonephila inaurata madagascariensis]|uniref:Uncharacterized protein n=1 Tax=Trichonephila inaurata madagascariensis TaxID=2747483 RepID=A0A8X7C969_9ARAC|nr:hypothetical protein TNIN_251461 [Trichonephila inaurata madagascariensis]
MMVPVLHGRPIVLTRLVVDSQIRIGCCCGTKPPVSFFRVIFHPNGIKKGDQKVGWPGKSVGRKSLLKNVVGFCYRNLFLPPRRKVTSLQRNPLARREIGLHLTFHRRLLPVA